MTKEQHDKDIQDTKDIAYTWADTAQQVALQEIADRVSDIYHDMYTKTTVDAKLAEVKAVIVTVSNNVPSHSSEDIFALLQAGKVVYLLYNGNYILCSSATPGEAKFESSYVITISDTPNGKSYPVQYFRMYIVKDKKFGSNAKTMASKDYVDDMISYCLNK